MHRLISRARKSKSLTASAGLKDPHLEKSLYVRAQSVSDTGLATPRHRSPIMSRRECGCTMVPVVSNLWTGFVAGGLALIGFFITPSWLGDPPFLLARNCCEVK